MLHILAHNRLTWFSVLICTCWSPKGMERKSWHFAEEMLIFNRIETFKPKGIKVRIASLLKFIMASVQTVLGDNTRNCIPVRASSLYGRSDQIAHMGIFQCMVLCKLMNLHKEALWLWHHSLNQITAFVLSIITITMLWSSHDLQGFADYGNHKA